MSRTAATLDPSKLTFLDDENLISAGRMVLVATYPSWSKKGTRHRVTVRDDGSAVGCTCTGAYYGRCYHQEQADEIVREWHRRAFRRLPSADLLREDSWLAHQPAGSLDTAQHRQLDAAGDVIAERFAAHHGRLDVAS